MRIIVSAHQLVPKFFYTQTFKVIHINKSHMRFNYEPSIVCTTHTIILYNKDSTGGIALDERNPYKYLLKLRGYTSYLTITL